MKRVAVTGIGMIDTLGNNFQDCTQEYFSDIYKDPVPYSSSPIDRYLEQKCFPVTSEIKLPDIHPKTVRTFDDNIKFALHAIHQALQDANVPESKNVAVVASNVTSGDEIMYASIKDLWEIGRMRKVRHFLAGMKDFLPGFVCQQWGFEGPNIALNAACATGIYNIDYAMKFTDQYEYVVCAASDDPLQALPVAFFSGLGALGTHSTPFGEGRDGFIPGQGGACFILESEEKAKERGAKVHAWLYPVGFGSDAYAATAPSPEGVGARLAMNNALIKGVDFVNAHATSTPLGDEVEFDAIKDLLGDIEVISPKRKLGHTMGTSGLLEAIYGIAKCKKENKKLFLNNSFGFGGKCASQIIEVNND